MFMLQVNRIFANPLMDLVHIWHHDRYWSKHFLVTTSCERDVVMRTRRSFVKGVMCEQGGSHMKRMITCEPDCGCVNWLVMFEWGHV